METKKIMINSLQEYTTTPYDKKLSILPCLNQWLLFTFNLNAEVGVSYLICFNRGSSPTSVLV